MDRGQPQDRSAPRRRSTAEPADLDRRPLYALEPPGVPRDAILAQPILAPFHGFQRRIGRHQCGWDEEFHDRFAFGLIASALRYGRDAQPDLDDSPKILFTLCS